MNTFLVFKVIAECAPLIIGGKDKTVLHKEIKKKLIVREIKHQTLDYQYSI